MKSSLKVQEKQTLSTVAFVHSFCSFKGALIVKRNTVELKRKYICWKDTDEESRWWKTGLKKKEIDVTKVTYKTSDISAFRDG